MTEPEKKETNEPENQENVSPVPEEITPETDPETGPEDHSEVVDNQENMPNMEGLLDKLGFHKKDKHKKELKELKDKLAESNDAYLRLAAEFDNYKKRSAKERIEWTKLAGQEIMSALLPVLDDFGRAMKQMETSTNPEALQKGVELIYQKMNHILEQRGLREMESVGKEFNVEHHEAITEVPAPTDELKGKVLDEVEKGYFLNDKIIRFAKVVVGK